MMTFIAYLAAILPMYLWLPFHWLLPSVPYEMDHGPSTAMGTFFAILPHYTRLFYVIAGVGLGGAIYAHHLGYGMPALFLLCAAADALLFNGFLIFFVEGYYAAKYPRNWNFTDPPRASNYTATKYAWVLALGCSAVILLLTGAAWMALRMA